MPLLFASSACLHYSAHLAAFLNSLEDGTGDYPEILSGDRAARSLFLQALRVRNGKLRSCLYHAKEERDRMTPGVKPGEPRETKPSPDQLEGAWMDLEVATDVHNRAVGASRDFLERPKRFCAAREWYLAQERFERSSGSALEDCLAGERLLLECLCKVDLRSLARTGAELFAAGREDLFTQLSIVASSIEAAKRGASDMLSLHPRAASPERPEPLAVETQTALSRDGVDSRTSLDEAIEALPEEAEIERAVVQTRVGLSEAQSALITLERARAVWNEYEIALEQCEDRAIGRLQQWQGWNKVVYAVQSHLDQLTLCARERLGCLVQRFSGPLLCLDEVSIDPYGRVFAKGLLPVLLSASQAWLLGVAVMAAIAVWVKAPILVLDGADILDDRNKIRLVKWLLAEIYPRFAHTILLSTARGENRDKGTLSFEATKWWIQDGELSRSASPVYPGRVDARGVLA